MDHDAQATQLELRVLTGLHQGAALLLIDEEIVLGSAPACDVVLLDDGIAPRHLQIVLRDAGWAWASGEDGDAAGVFSPDPPRAGEAASLGRGSRLCIANVWLMLAGVADPWPTPAELRAWQRLPHEAAAQHTAEPAAAARRGTRAWVLTCLCLGLAGALLLALALWLPQGNSEQDGHDGRGGKAAPAPAGQPPAPRAAPPTLAMPVPLAPAQLQSVASALLAEHKLEQMVQVQAAPGQLRLHATLGPRGRANFEQSLLALQRRLGATTRIEATVTSAEATLPFRIQQVLMGGDSHVVLADGRAMYEGDQFGGFRLMSIREGVIVFAGPRKVEVSW